MEPLPDFLLPLQFVLPPFPREAVEAAVERREESTPHLLDALAWADTHIDEADAPDPGHVRPLYALYLLAQFRETRAYPLIVRLFRNPRHEEVTGDVATASLPQILASVCGGDLAPIKSLIEDAAVDEWVRGAAVDSLGVLATEGHLPREDLAAYLGTLFAGRLEQEPNHVWDSVVGVCVDRRLAEHLDLIRRLYRDEVADETYMGLDEVEAEMVLPLGESPYPQSLLPQGLIDSAAAELEHWDCFRVRTPAEEEADRLEAEREDDFFALLEKEELAESLASPGTYVRQTPKVGRNEPCPCGSGRKFKKCCGAAA